MADIVKRTAQIDVRSISFPVTPVIPPDVSYGQKVLPSWGNSVTQCLEDLWTNLQAVGAVSIADPTSVKGDMMVRGATALSRLGIGTEGQFLQVDSASPVMVKWQTITPSTMGAVPTSRQVIAGAGLSGGGALSADVTLTANVKTVAGRTGDVVIAVADVSGAVANTRRVIAGAGMSGGGPLSADVTMNALVTSVFGRTGDVVLSPADITTGGGVPATRKVIAGSGLSGGGALSADVTLSANIAAIQTPWLQNIDGGNFTLGNVSGVTITKASAPYLILSGSGYAADVKHWRWIVNSDPTRSLQLQAMSDDMGSSANVLIVSRTGASSGNVGINKAPLYPLDVQGIISSSSGGFRFPDGTVQDSAALPSSRQVLAGYGLTGGGPLSTDVTLAQVDDTTVQRVRVGKAGSVVGTRREIQFSEGVNTSVVVSDDAANNRVNVQISVTGEGGAVPVPDTRKVIAGYGLTGGGALSADVTLAQVDNTSIQKVTVQANGTPVGTRSVINFKGGGDATITGVDTGSSTELTLSVIASQTPWRSNIDAAGYDLTNAGLIESKTGGFKFPDGSTQASAYSKAAAQTPWIQAIDGGGFALSNAGQIESKTGGFRFPDGTTQTTAATSTPLTPWKSDVDAAQYALYNPSRISINAALDPSWRLYVYGGDIGTGVSTTNIARFHVGDGNADSLLLQTVRPVAANNWDNVVWRLMRMVDSSVMSYISWGGYGKDRIAFGHASVGDALGIEGNKVYSYVGHQFNANTDYYSGAVGAGSWYYGSPSATQRCFFGMESASENTFRLFSVPLARNAIACDLPSGNVDIYGNVNAATFSTPSSAPFCKIAPNIAACNANEIVRASSDGHVYTNFINYGPNPDDGSPLNYVIYTEGNFLRKRTWSSINGSITPQWSNVQSKPTAGSDPNAAIGLAWYMNWKNYGANHVIFDASQGTAPNGAGVNSTNANTPWSASYPTLMGWNGSSTYGVRVDVCRYADSAPWAGISGRPDVIVQGNNRRVEFNQTLGGNADMNLWLQNTNGGAVCTYGMLRIDSTSTNPAHELIVVLSAGQPRFHVTAEGWVNIWIPGVGMKKISIDGNGFLKGV